MPSMVWSNGDLSVPQLIQDFAHTKRLPVIVKVTQGYYGDGQLKLPIGQVSFHSDTFLLECNVTMHIYYYNVNFIGATQGFLSEAG